MSCRLVFEMNSIFDGLFSDGSDEDGATTLPFSNKKEYVQAQETSNNVRFVSLSAEDVEAAQQTVRPTNSIKKTEWVRRLFLQWKASVSVPPAYFAKKFNELTDLQVNAMLCKFILEVRRI